eukprot:8375893-Pyramimonas_sp.AAC.2
MASSAGVVGIPVRILVGKAERAKCGRCWRYTVEAAAEEAGGDLCGRCEGVLKELVGGGRGGPGD